MHPAVTNGTYDVARVRADFPILSKKIYDKPLGYLDNAAWASHRYAASGQAFNVYDCRYNLFNPKLDAVMSEANKAYDRGDFDDAKGIALKVLTKDPANIRMRRIVVSSACIDGDSTEAQKHYLQLPPSDREQMKVRCARYGVSFNDQ
jgi:hypothetical protein